MILALDTYYYGNTAKCVGVLFQWADEEPQKILSEVTENIHPYVPGEFYKRELPSLLSVIKQVNLETIGCIVVDSHVQLNEGKKGLGMHLYEVLDEKIPIIGVAKRKFHKNEEHTIEVLRGESNNPLYISSVGINLLEAAALIKNMHGNYRFPSILKTLDQWTKNEKEK